MRSPRWDCRDSCYSSGALLDRFTHHVHILKMNGESYRLEGSRQNLASSPKEEPADAQTQVNVGSSQRRVARPPVRL